MPGAAQPTAPFDASNCPIVTVLDLDRADHERRISTGASLLSDLDDALRAIENRYPSSLHGALQDALGRARELSSFGGDFAQPRLMMPGCSAVGPDMQVPEESVAIDLQPSVVELDFADSLPAGSPRSRTAADADGRARGSEWGRDKVVTSAIRFYVVHLPSLVNDLETAAQAARGTHPRWRGVAAAIERARSRAREAIRLYDASLVRALCRIGAARRSWPTHRARAQKALLGAAELLGADPELGNLEMSLRELASASDTKGSTILQAEERLHGLLRSRACAPPAADR